MDGMIDAHHHLWKFKPVEYRWIDNSMPVLRRDYLPVDLEPQMAESGVTGTVVIQARQKIEETRWLIEQAEGNGFIRGVVGWVDLNSKHLEEQLDEFTIHPGLVGVRHVLQDEPDDEFMLRPEFIRGIKNLNDYGLTYDLLIFPKHLEKATELVKRFPNQKFVLDHISKPLIKSGLMRTWQDDIFRLAEQENVWCKISGMVTEADLENWKYEDFVPYLDVVTEAFGQDRLMVGSDWPVCRLAGEYPEVLKIPVRYFEAFSFSEKEKIFKNNCIEFYGLDDL